VIVQVFTNIFHSLFGLKKNLFSTTRKNINSFCWIYIFNHFNGHVLLVKPKGKRPSVDQGPSGVVKYPTLLGPMSVWNQKNY